MPLDFMPLGRSYVLTSDNRYFLRFTYSLSKTWVHGIHALRTVFRYAMKHRRAAALWKSAHAELSSAESWRTRFELSRI
ncbi:MAG: hypothetical protein JOZ62_05300 [Acidobacteriaceae bacterium]|nr:hypothetical protein [Acidobacteriaceae bacterium]